MSIKDVPEVSEVVDGLISPSHKHMTVLKQTPVSYRTTIKDYRTDTTGIWKPRSVRVQEQKFVDHVMVEAHTYYFYNRVEAAFKYRHLIALQFAT